MTMHCDALAVTPTGSYAMAEPGQTDLPGAPEATAMAQLRPERPEGACAFCWGPVAEDFARKSKVGGRPKVYCDDDCRRAFHAWKQTERVASLAATRMTPEAWAAFRGDVWALCNSRAWNKGVAVAQRKGRAPWSGA